MVLISIFYYVVTTDSLASTNYYYRLKIDLVLAYKFKQHLHNVLRDDKNILIDLNSR